MVTLAAWTRNWRSIVETLETADEFIPITASHDGSDFEILRISRYSEVLDGESPYVRTSVRAFDDSTGFFTHRTRDTGMGRFITKGSSEKRAWVLEPGEDLLAYNAAKEGTSEKELIRLTRLTEVGRQIVRRVRSTERKKQTRREDEHQQQVRHIAEEAAIIASERNHAQRELARRGAE